MNIGLCQEKRLIFVACQACGNNSKTLPVKLIFLLFYSRKTPPIFFQVLKLLIMVIAIIPASETAKHIIIKI